MLVVSGIGLFGVYLKTCNGAQKLVSLAFERLHLFPDGIHGCASCDLESLCKFSGLGLVLIGYENNVPLGSSP